MAGRGAQTYLREDINTAVFARSTPPVEWSVDRAENIDDPGRMRLEAVYCLLDCLLLHILLLITFVRTNEGTSIRTSVYVVLMIAC